MVQAQSLIYWLMIDFSCFPKWARATIWVTVSIGSPIYVYVHPAQAEMTIYRFLPAPLHSTVHNEYPVPSSVQIGKCISHSLIGASFLLSGFFLAFQRHNRREKLCSKVMIHGRYSDIYVQVNTRHPFAQTATQLAHTGRFAFLFYLWYIQ